MDRLQQDGKKSRKNSVEKQGQRFTVSSKKRRKQMRQPIWSFATNDVLDLSPTYQNDSRAFSPSDSLEQFRC
jgi:hypothetical protein